MAILALAKEKMDFTILNSPCIELLSITKTMCILMGLWCLISLLQVDVGNFLRLKSCVLYTELENLEQPLINVEVVAHVTRPECRSSEVSINLFFFVSKAVQQFSDCVAQQSLWEGHLRIIWNILLPLFLSHKFVRRTSPILLDLFF